MQKNYEPKEFEKNIYQSWLNKKYFHADADSKKPHFSVVMPPPNVTGQLHIGHALNDTIQDILVRYKRMKGFDTLWLPGTDHAAIATEAKVVEAITNEGKTKEEIGREEFVKLGWDWYEKYGNRICEQLQGLGVSCDWDRKAFTMDENLNRAVKHVFVSYYNKGLIYKGKRIVNWCPHCKSAISDIENEYVDQNTSLWSIRYPYEDGTGEIVVATTRPETMFGDTAVAVNPRDPRYKDIVGKNVILPLVNRPIPVVADDYSEMDFGTGAVKITPAHDPNDYELGLRHNLEVISCIGDDGILTEAAGEFAGLDRFEARKQVVKKLEQEGYLVKITKYKNKVGTCQRCHTITEPKISTQWFVKMEDLAKPAIEVVKNGKLKFFPKRFEKQYINWLANIKDWCISRQIWLGHRIPAYTCEDCGNLMVEENDVHVCSKCGSHNIVQDPDVLDTWFSSALWPFSTLGYPNQTKDLKTYYPTSTLVTGYDIIAFWVSKMVFSGLEFMGDVPFEHCVINGLVRDGIGRKMSKSLGNGVDPIELIEKYGADALRMSLVHGMSMGADVKYTESKAESSKIFINKLFNASKFVLMNLDEYEKQDISKCVQNYADKWILSEYNKLVKHVTRHMDKYEQGIAISSLIDFIWSKFCDWYIEASKNNIYSQDKTIKNKTMNVLVYVLEGVLKLIHPFIPFVTEYIYQELPGHNESIMIEKYPEYTEKLNFKDGAKFEKVISIIKSIRNLRSEMNVADNKRTAIFVEVLSENDLVEKSLDVISKLGYGNFVKVVSCEDEIADKHIKILGDIANIYIPMNELVDTAKEQARLEKEIETLKKEIARSEGMLNNQNFIARAPGELVAKEREKLERNQILLTKTQQALADL